MNLKLIVLTALLSVTVLGAHAQQAASAMPAAKTVHHRTTKATAAKPSTKTAHAKTPRKVTPKMQAARNRMHQCGAEWQRDKAAGKTKNTTWPKYWHTCSVRLKAKA